MATSPTGGLRLPWPAPLFFFFFFFLLSPLALAVAQELPPGFPGDMPLPGDMPQISMGFMDGLALLMFKKYLGNTSLALSSWTHGDPCDKTRPPWAGVICTGGAVTGIRLRGKGLFGTINETAIDPLTHIAGLRTIGLSNNDFSGEIPPLSGLVALKSIFLSNNRFSGVIDGDYFSDMTHLKKVWLAGNSFTGKIPPSLTKLPHLMELHLENNQFSGGLPEMNIPTLSSFNVSNNRFEGAVPAALRKFGDSAFKGNAGLCFPQAGNNSCATAAAVAAASPGEDKEVRSWRAVMVGIVLGTLLLALIAGLFIIKKRRRGVFDTLGVEHGGAGLESARMPPAAGGGGQGGSERHGNSSRRTSSGGHKRHDSSSRKGSVHSKSSASSDSSELGELVLLNPEKAGTLVMADLMKAAAEVLGSSPLGTTYKVILTDGGAVAVKRLRDLHRMGKDGFEAEIRRLGRLRHPNVLPPLAYHYDKKEKLVLFEYVDKGSLLYALHGDRGAHHGALTWPTRLRIVRGIARGMAYLHSELAASDVPHGNLKSCNVLLGPTYEPLLIDYGLTPLVNPSQAAISMFAYRSPEAAQRRQVSPKCDVYCLGVVVLEVVTGKFPSQYLSSGMGGTDVVEWVAAAAEERREAELIDPEIAAGGGAKRSTASIERLLRIAAACTDPRPENRPSMKEAARRIEAVTVDGSIAADDDSGAAAAAPLKEGHAVLTTRLSARERSGETFGIS